MRRSEERKTQAEKGVEVSDAEGGEKGQQLRQEQEALACGWAGGRGTEAEAASAHGMFSFLYLLFITRYFLQTL